MKHIKNSRGGALVMVMIVLVALSTLAIGLFKLHETDAVEAVFVEQTDQAFWVAEAGLQRALHKLRYDDDYRKYDIEPRNAGSPYVETDTVGNGSYVAELWGDGSHSNFWIRSRGSVMGKERLLTLYAVLNEFGAHGLITLNGDSEIRAGGTINGSVYQNGELNTRGNVTITGDVLADNYDEFGSQGHPIPEDGYIDMEIDQTYFDPYLDMSSTGTTITDPLDLSNKTVVVSSSIDPSSIVSSGGPGVLVVKGDQTFSKDLTIGDDVTVIVDGDLKISKNGTLGDNVTLFATGKTDLFKHASAQADTGTGCAILSLEGIKVWKEFDFDGLVFTEGDFYADKDLNVDGTIVTRDGFTLKKDATVTFNDSLIPAEVRENMISLTFIVNESSWNELPAN